MPKTLIKTKTKRNRRGDMYKRIVRLYLSGKDAPEVAKATGRSRITVYHHLRRAVASGEVVMRPRKMTDVNAIVELLSSGESQSDVSRAVGLTRQYISLVAKDARAKGLLKKNRVKGKRKAKPVARSG